MNPHMLTNKTALLHLRKEQSLIMQNGKLRRVTELSATTRQTVEALIGRSLKEDEALSINVYKPAPTGELRQQISQQLLERADKTAANCADVPDHEIEAAIDEAADHVRHFSK
jgi:hypothetical protein